MGWSQEQCGRVGFVWFITLTREMRIVFNRATGSALDSLACRRAPTASSSLAVFFVPVEQSRHIIHCVRSIGPTRAIPELKITASSRLDLACGREMVGSRRCSSWCIRANAVIFFLLMVVCYVCNLVEFYWRSLQQSASEYVVSSLLRLENAPTAVLYPI